MSFLLLPSTLSSFLPPNVVCPKETSSGENPHLPMDLKCVLPGNNRLMVQTFLLDSKARLDCVFSVPRVRRVLHFSSPYFSFEQKMNEKSLN